MARKYQSDRTPRKIFNFGINQLPNLPSRDVNKETKCNIPGSVCSDIRILHFVGNRQGCWNSLGFQIQRITGKFK